MTRKKNPWVAAILNFIIPGLGYLYVGKKHVLVSVGFIIVNLLSALFLSVPIEDLSYIDKYLDLGVPIVILVSLIFSFDAYQDGLEINSHQNKKVEE